MSRYIEEFRIGSNRYSIEDYEDGQPLAQHFFGHRHAQAKDARFHLLRTAHNFGHAPPLPRHRMT